MNDNDNPQKDECSSESEDAPDKANDLERRYQSLFEQSPDGILLIDTDGTILDFNRAAHTMLGFTRDEFTKISISQLSLQKPMEIQKCIEKLMQTGKAQFEAIYRTKDGTIKNIFVNSKMIVISGKAIMHSIWRDITERKLFEEHLHKTEKFIQGILESVDEGFIVIDHDLKILSANNAYLNQVNKKEDEVIGRHCYEISHRSSKPCYYHGEDCPVKQTFLTGNPSIAIHVHHDKDDNPVHTEIKSFPLRDSAGITTSAIEIIHNTTEKRKLEAQLRHAQKMEAVGQLAGGIAHDFNNILTAIVGYASLIQMDLGEKHPMSRNVEEILGASERAASLTQGLLTFSRKQELRRIPVNLNDIIENIEKLLSRLIGEEIEVTVQLGEKDLNLMADSGQIEQVLMNLATNARDAMPHGGQLSIKTESVILDQDFVKLHGYGSVGEHALISVADTGSGIDDRIKDHIFEPFFTTKEVGQGTGLGLSIAYGIVKQHGGYITCYSELGKGTVFKIYLPMIGPHIAPVHEDEVLPIIGGTETVLIAEDNATLRSLAREILEQFGYTVFEAVDGEDAVSTFIVNDRKIDILVLDVMMPKKNGIEAFEEIRKVRPDVKAVFTSGYTADTLQRRGIIEKELNFIAKPVSPSELLKKVREVLDKA